MMSFSLSTSMLEVASSKRYTGLRRRRPRARASRCRWPPERLDAPLQQLGGEALLPHPEEGRQVHLLQRLPQLLLSGIGAGQAQVLLYGAFE